jgi:hypothetical protein
MLSEQRHPLGQPGTAALLRDNADRAMAHSGPPLHIGQAAASPFSVIPIPSSTTSMTSSSPASRGR